MERKLAKEWQLRLVRARADLGTSAKVCASRYGRRQRTVPVQHLSCLHWRVLDAYPLCTLLYGLSSHENQLIFHFDVYFSIPFKIFDILNLPNFYPFEARTLVSIYSFIFYLFCFCFYTLVYTRYVNLFRKLNEQHRISILGRRRITNHLSFLR